MMVVRGNNVFPSAIEGIVRTVAGVVEFQMRVATGGAMNDLELTVEARDGSGASSIVHEVTRLIQERLHFRPIVKVAAPGSLPRYELKAKRLVKK
jgi:phenylacetate-CoA ligase